MDIPALEEGLKNKEADVRAASAAALCLISPQADTAIPALRTALKDKDLRVRRLSTEALWRMGPRAKAAVPALIQVLRDADASIHSSVASVLRRSAGHRVLVLTYRDLALAEATRAQLVAWGVAFDELVIAGSLEAKGELCREYGVDLFFDDQDECIAAVPERVLVCKVRNGGNFDFVRRQWVSTAQLTRLIR